MSRGVAPSTTNPRKSRFDAILERLKNLDEVFLFIRRNYRSYGRFLQPGARSGH